MNGGDRNENKGRRVYGEGWKPATIRARVNQINRRNEDE